MVAKMDLALSVVRGLWYQTRGEGVAAVEGVTREIANALAKGDTVCIHGFGTFKAVDGSVQFKPHQELIKCLPSP